MNLHNLTFRGKPIYYGWVIVTGMALVSVVGSGMLGVNYGLFIESIGQEMGIGSTFFGFAQTGRLIGVAASSALVGYLLDRYGAGRPLLVAGILFGSATVAVSFITEGWQMVAIFVLMGAIGLRAQGGNLFAMVPISRFFVRDRGKAMARVFLGTPIGIFITAPLTVLLINNIGWRSTLVVLGTVGGVVTVLVSFLMRRSPEDMGLLPDGDSPDKVAPSKERPDQGNQQPQAARGAMAEYSWTRSQATHTFTFWKLSVAFGLTMFAGSTIGLFRIPHFVEQGISAQIVGYSLSVEALVAFAIVFPVGYALSRFQPRYLLVLSSMAMAGSYLTTMFTTKVWHVFVANSLFGMGAASRGVLMNTLWPNYFGSRNIGKIRGLSVPITMAFSFAGAPIAGMVKDNTGSYLPVWWVALFLIAASAALFLATPKPTPPAEASETTEQSER